MLYTNKYLVQNLLCLKYLKKLLCCHICYIFRKSICKSGLYVLRWTSVLVERALKSSEEDGVDYNSLVITQANLLAVVTAFGKRKCNHKAYYVVSSSYLTSGECSLSVN